MRLSCRSCSGNELVEMINLGEQPIAHRLLSSPDEEEFRHPFVVHHCKDCGLIQICNPIDPRQLYLDYNYWFSSWKLEPQIGDEIKTIAEKVRAKSVFEIGCNDGKFLELLKAAGASSLAGIEPNISASQKARSKGFNVYSEMLNEQLCQELERKFGRFDIVVARHVLEHVTDINLFFGCVNILLADKGFLFLGVPDFEIGLSMGDCSVLWEEHVSYFTESVINNTLSRFGLRPVFVNRYNFSGGVMAILAERASEPINMQPIGGLKEKADLFAQKVNRYGSRLREILSEYRRNNYKVIIYGVGCRAHTAVNALRLGEYINFAIDDQAQRQNRYMPGSKLPIYSPEILKDSPQPVVCLLAVNQENESSVMTKLRNITDANIEFASLFSPSEIWLELEKLNSRLLSYK